MDGSGEFMALQITALVMIAIAVAGVSYTIIAAVTFYRRWRG